jgi:hypothetical protein
VKYLRLRALENLKDTIDGCLLDQNPVRGEQAISNFKRVETPRDKGVSILEDTIEITSAFLEEEDVLFTFPGVLGKESGRFVRGDVVAFMSAAKRGKSWWEWYTALLGLYHGFRVVMFNLEMKDNQYLRRCWTSLVGLPRRRWETQSMRTISVPKFFREGDKGPWEVQVESKEYETVDLSEIGMMQKSFKRQFRSGNIRLFTFPAYSATMDTISACLDNLRYYGGFIPDIIVIDYGDLIAPSGGGRQREYRHQLDDIWKSMRRMAQERNALLITASQTGRISFSQDASEKDVSEDIRKIAHVAKLFVINSNQAEREKGVCRIQQLVERDDRLSGRQVTVLQCLDLGQVCLDSKLTGDVLSLGEEESTKSKKRKR